LSPLNTNCFETVLILKETCLSALLVTKSTIQQMLFLVIYDSFIQMKLLGKD